MPLVRIDLRQGKSAADRAAIGDAVHRALVETMNVPPLDRFQVIVGEHAPEGLVYDPTYLNVPRTDGVVFIQITLNTGRTVEMKKALYAKIADLLAPLGVRREDVLVSLVEVVKENWSFGNGVAQYA